jgi:excisionase family DNA binding protein
MEGKENLQGESQIRKLLTAKDVAEILGIAAKTVNKLVREGKLGCVQVTAKERRFTEDQIQEYIESRSSKVQFDRRTHDRVKSAAPKGGEKSLGFSRRSLIEEMRQWQ